MDSMVNRLTNKKADYTNMGNTPCWPHELCYLGITAAAEMVSSA